jgi:hypothetical protein
MGTGSRSRDWEALSEACVLFGFVMLYIWKLHLSHPWTGLLAPAFTIATHLPRREGARRLGFGWKEFRQASPVVLPWAAAISAVLLAAGALAGTVRNVPAGQASWGLGVYLVWGLFQQYLLNGFLANRLAEYAGAPESRLVPLAAATLFSLAHLPNWFLMAVTFLGGYISVRVYLRYRSLYVLGVAHGVVASVLFLVVPDSIGGHFLVGPRYLIDLHDATRLQ